jgi:hypothetical protein
MSNSKCKYPSMTQCFLNYSSRIYSYLYEYACIHTPALSPLPSLPPLPPLPPPIPPLPPIPPIPLTPRDGRTDAPPSPRTDGTELLRSMPATTRPRRRSCLHQLGSVSASLTVYVYTSCGNVPLVDGSDRPTQKCMGASMICWIIKILV